MLTTRDIEDLIGGRKTIVQKTPSRGYREEHLYKRCDLELEAVSDSVGKFTVFTRQNTEFIENFSIGLRCTTNDPTLRTITLVRYNGPHGESSRQPDGHYSKPHIHRITEAQIESGSSEPEAMHREITDRYTTFETALFAFLNDVGVENYLTYFPELLQSRLFDGCE